MSRPVRTVVRRVPAWLEWRRLLGPGDWQACPMVDGPPEQLELSADLARDAAADLAARLRGVGIGGTLLELEIVPALPRKDLRRAMAVEAKRYREGSVGFSRRGTRLDAEGRMSLTPERLALQLGERAKGLRVIDAFAGCGGNAIGFARAGCRVTAIELDAARLAMARHNAAMYGVADRIEFLGGDACALVAGREADLLFLDPPWGGRYSKERTALGDLPPCADILRQAKLPARTWIKVPPSFDPSCLPGAKPEAFFGSGEGDCRRVKFLLLELQAIQPAP